MSVLEKHDPKALEAFLDQLEEYERCAAHPAFLSKHVECVDPKTGEKFHFEMLEEDAGWYWQRELLDWSLDNNATIVLKGRQLGVTWVYCLILLHDILFTPGAAVLAYSINEDEAKLLVRRVWNMYLSLPDWLKSHVVLQTPTRTPVPSTLIEIRHEDGRVSSMQGMVSSRSAGHSRTAKRVVFDEYSHIEYAADLWKAGIPTMADGGSIHVVSTANGVSNVLTGGGNFYHHLWSKAENEYHFLKKKFLHWGLHPKRGPNFKRDLPMTADQKAEQYPDTPEEAFLMSGRPFFDRAALLHYSKERVLKPLYRFTFTRDGVNAARVARGDDGLISLFEKPHPGMDYAIGVDCATGQGLDFTSAHVIHLSTGKIVAHLHGKIDYDIAAEQIHYLGRYFNDARVAIERGGGYGDTVIAYLRDGKDGRPPYKRLYRFQEETRLDLPERKQYGFPMTAATRPRIINEVERWLRERALPGVDEGTMGELYTFVHADTNPSPRAQDGTNDDRVFSLGITLEMYRIYGHHKHDVRKQKRRKRRRPQYRPLGQ